MRAKQITRSFERVYFLGAGFSAGVHYPVGKRLVSELVQYLKGTPPRVKKELSGFSNSIRTTADGRLFCQETLEGISTVLQRYFLSTIDEISDVDVTEFFSISHALAKNLFLIGDRYSMAHQKSLAAPRKPHYRVSLSELYNLLAAAVLHYFVDIAQNIPKLPIDMEAILNKVSCQRDAIISFDWDEEVDYYFTEKRNWNVAYTLGSWQTRKGVLILKPHGSIGWYDVIRGIGNKDNFFIAEGDERLDQYERRILSFYEIERAVTIESEQKKRKVMYFCPPVITPPTFAKSFEYVEQNWIWQDIMEVCSNAKQFVFLGYSLPQDDYLTRAAIRNALRKNPRHRLRCLVVNRDHTDQMLHANYASIFKSALDPEINYLHWKFGDKRKDIADLIQRQLEKAVLKKEI
jgi:hypothetical protein